MGIEVVNARNVGGRGKSTVMVYVGRKSSLEKAKSYVGNGMQDSSVLGNQFEMRSEADRERVIKEYRVWLWERVKERGKVFSELVRIRKMAERGNVSLVCWCSPRACHSDVIRSCVEWMVKENIG